MAIHIPRGHLGVVVPHEQTGGVVSLVMSARHSITFRDDWTEELTERYGLS